jgi:polar amino acid transport system substrate-binding protein
VRGIKRAGSIVVLVAVLGAAALSSGCGSSDTGAGPKAKIVPPAIAKAGVLRAAIDLTYPPFGGDDKGAKAGLDVDVASALAERLGLKLEIVDAKPEAGAVLLRDKQVDVMIAALPIDRAVQLDVAFAGTYANDGPVVFGLTESTMTVQTLAGRSVAVQKESAAYWLLAEEYGEGSLTVVATLRDALAAVASGQVDFAAGDGIVGAYMLRDFPKVRFNGQMAPAVPLGVAVGKDGPELEQAVRGALDGLATQGVLETLRRKWTGDVPRLAGASSAAAPTP